MRNEEQLTNYFTVLICVLALILAILLSNIWLFLMFFSFLLSFIYLFMNGDRITKKKSSLIRNGNAFIFTVYFLLISLPNVLLSLLSLLLLLNSTYSFYKIVKGELNQCKLNIIEPVLYIIYLAYFWFSFNGGKL